MLAKAGDLIARTWRLYEALFPMAPLVFLAPLLVYQVAGAAMAPLLGPQGDVGQAVTLTLGIIGMTALLAMGIAYAGAIVVREADAIAEKRHVDPVQAAKDLQRRADQLLRGSLVVYLGFVVGAVFLVIPGIILFVQWFLVLPILVHEFRTPREALARSIVLMDGRRLVVLVVVVALALVTSGLVGLSVLAASWNVWVGAVLLAVLGALVLPFFVLASAVTYRDVVPLTWANLPKNALEEPTKHRYACPRCGREYLLPRLPRAGTPCPACRSPQTTSGSA